jgi:hypothetical protein
MYLNDHLPDFDQLVALHNRDPAALEALREKMIQNFIATAPAQHRPALQHTAFLMDRARESAANPLDAAAAAWRLMASSVNRLHGALEHLMHELASQQAEAVLQKMRVGYR